MSNRSEKGLGVNPSILSKIGTMYIKDISDNKVRFAVSPLFLENISYISMQDIALGVDIKEVGGIERLIFKFKSDNKIKLLDSIVYSVWLHELAHIRKDEGSLTIDSDELRANSMRGDIDLYVNIAAILWYWFYYADISLSGGVKNSHVVKDFIEGFLIHNKSFSFLLNEEGSIEEISKFVIFFNVFFVNFQDKINRQGNKGSVNAGADIFLKAWQGLIQERHNGLDWGDFEEDFSLADFNNIEGPSNEGGIFYKNYKEGKVLNILQEKDARQFASDNGGSYVNKDRVGIFTINDYSQKQKRAESNLVRLLSEDSSFSLVHNSDIKLQPTSLGDREHELMEKVLEKFLKGKAQLYF